MKFAAIGSEHNRPGQPRIVPEKSCEAQLQLIFSCRLTSAIPHDLLRNNLVVMASYFLIGPRVPIDFLR